MLKLRIPALQTGGTIRTLKKYGGNPDSESTLQCLHHSTIPLSLCTFSQHTKRILMFLNIISVTNDSL